jgi:hypothetical protein
MIAPEDPPGFVVRTEAQKAAWDNGFRLERGVESERRLVALRFDDRARRDLDRMITRVIWVRACEGVREHVTCGFQLRG